MAVDASPALYRLVADQSKLDDRVSKLCKEQETSDEALLDAIDRKDRDGKNIALARIKRNATKQAYEEFQKEAAEELTVDEVYDRKRKLQDTGSFMRMVRAHSFVADHVVNGDQSEDVYDFRDVDELSSAQENGPIVVNVVDTNHASDAVEFLPNFLWSFFCSFQPSPL
jgi:hypothetical protein